MTCRSIASALLSTLLLSSPALAQTPLTLTDALRLATEGSETLAAARAGESRADAERQRTFSARLPQVSFAGTYSRTLASEFSAAVETSGPSCAPFTVDPAQAIDARVAEIERAATCGSLAASGFDFANLPFGQRNVYQFGFSFSQTLYSGGRISAQERQAQLGQQVAGLATSSAEAQLILDVTRAFYDAALTDRLLAIAESGYTQAARTYDQTRLAFEAGRQPEYELLRAQVARDMQQPVVIRRRADRDIAYLRLRQLLEIPAGEPVALTVDLDSPALPPPAPFADGLARAQAGGVSDDRASVRQAAALVQVREAGVHIARADRLPQLSLSSALTPVGYSRGLAFDFRTNWSVAATVQMPLFTGFRLRANELAARADVAEAEAQLRQAREIAALDVATALQDLAAAEAVFQASAGTIQQAERAYAIAELRNREGLSTQLELSDSRLSLQVAQANRAQAARDLQIARARVALLPNLPAGAR